MKITFIHHSSFCIEDTIIGSDGTSAKYALIFDYFSGEIPEFSDDCNVVFFASHKHFDHFSKSIFKYADKYKNVLYVLSKETKMNEKYMDRWNVSLKARPQINYVTYDESYDYTLNNIHINVETLKSTDSGVAFIVNIGEKCFYHSGDLNYWTWDKYTKEDNDSMLERYMIEMNKIKDRHFDAAFVVLDNRIGEDFHIGMDIFMDKANADVVFPMHMWYGFEPIADLKKLDSSKAFINKIIDIKEDGQNWEF